MNGKIINDKPRLQFGLRSLFFTIAVVALLVWSAQKLHDCYFSMPLAEAVASFNARAGDDPVGKLEPPITEDEVVASIHSQLPTLNATSQVKAIYNRIARIRRLPKGAALDPIPGYATASGKHYTVWWINLNVMTSKNSGYGLRIRETNNPAAASLIAPTDLSDNADQG
jgi:hypothetical protein